MKKVGVGFHVRQGRAPLIGLMKAMIEVKEEKLGVDSRHHEELQQRNLHIREDALL